MAVSRMKLATIIGPLRDFDAVVLGCIAGHGFHPESPVSITKMIRGLYPLDTAHPYQDKLRRIDRLLGLLGLGAAKKDAVPADDMPDGRLSEIESLVDSLLAERGEHADRIAEDEHLFSQLKLLHNIDVPLEGLYNVTYMKFRFGRLPRDIFNHFYPVIKDFPDVFFFVTDIQKDYVYGMYMVPRAGAEKIDALLSSLQFERIRISEKLHGSSEEAEQMARADLEQHRARIGEIAGELASIAERERGALIAAFRHCRRITDAFTVKRYAVRSEESFYLIGWVPEAEFPSFEKSFGPWENVSVLLVDDEQGSLDEFTPPTKLRNNGFFRSFEPLVAMYGLPSYKEIDPTPLVALTYPLLFGIMFGDLGHAALLLLAGLFMWKRMGMWLGRILCWCAAGSALFGVIYGSVFGYEELLPFGFHVAHSSDTVFLALRISLYAGVGLLALSILLNVLNGARQRDWEKLFFGPASLTGLVLYTGVAFTVLPFIGFGASPFPPPVLLVMIALPTVVVFFKEPLGFLRRKKRVRLEEGVGGFLISGFFELFEVYLSFITNTISFLRVGAYAISHAALMGVVYSIAQSPDGSHSIAVLIIGNLLVAGLEAVLVAIQVLRLQYYEIFGRFFSGNGKAYMPTNAEE